MFSIIEMHHQIFRLFYKRLQQWCFWVAIPNVVIDVWYIKSHWKIHQMPWLFRFQRFPFDWKNPLGYLVAVYLQHAMIKYMFILISLLTSLGSGAFMFCLTALDDITDCLKSVNGYAKTKGKQSKAIERIAQYIQLHSDIKQLSKPINFFNYTNCWHVRKSMISCSSS